MRRARGGKPEGSVTRRRETARDGRKGDYMRWKCPKCGRVFERENRRHSCEKPLTVDAYIEAQDPAARQKLREIRAVIRSAVPDAEERIAWSMPTYRKGRDLIHFAACGKHIGLYPGGEATAAFEKELAGFDTSKGTVRLPYDRELPEELIARIARWCRARYGK